MRELFDSRKIEELAKTKGFVERRSKLTAKAFTESLIFGSDKQINLSLNELSEELYANYDLEITKQGLDQRFNAAAVVYLEALLKKAISQKLSCQLDHSLFNAFKAVKIKDSTKFVVPDSLSKLFPCNGLGGHLAGMKIAYEYDLKTGTISDLELGLANVQDHTDAISKVSTIKSGDLVLRDLGFISVDVLNQIDQQGGYFINRLHYNVMVYSNKGVKLDYVKIYKYMKKKSISRLEMAVNIGQKQCMPVRMIIEMLPENQAQKRLRHINKISKRKGWKASEKYKIKSCLNVFITNVPSTMLPNESIRQIYRLRWQIELMFKTWKSVLQIDKIKPMKAFRYQCHLYARLIWAVISHRIHYAVCGWEKLSHQKMFKYLYRKLRIIQKLIINRRWEKLELFFISTYKYAFKRLLLESRKGEQSSFEIIKNYGKKSFNLTHQII